MSKAVAPLLQTDAYKLDHRRQYPEGTEEVFSNYTNRGSRIEGIEHVVHFGLQGFLVDLTNQFDDFFEGDIEDIVEEYEARVNSILGPNTVGSDHIRALWALGYLPLAFGSLPEGTRVPVKVPSFTIRNTHPDFYWLVNYLETWISASVWQPSTSATLADHFKTLLVAGAEDTDQEGLAGVQFQGHDFSYRGMAGNTAAAASGAGHLLSFQGSDSLVSLEWVDQHYGSAYEQPYEGWLLGSVPATEHSVMCAGGEEDERETFARLLKLYPAGIVSVVSDTWDLWNVLTNILPDLKDEIMARDGKLVIRPDSGDPVDIIAGTGPWSVPAKPSEKGVIELLWDVFGGTVNEQGYKVLDPHIGAIYGDSITFDRAREIIRRLAAKGFASTNIVFGVGSYTYQYQTRDTFSSAIKATWVRIKGEEKAISKDPITDNGTKKSAKGMLVVLEEDGKLVLLDNLTRDEWLELTAVDKLQDVYVNGEFIYWQSLDDIRAVLAGK